MTCVLLTNIHTIKKYLFVIHTKLKPVIAAGKTNKSFLNLRTKWPSVIIIVPNVLRKLCNLIFI